MEEKIGQDEKGKIKQDIHNLDEKKIAVILKSTVKSKRVFPSITGKVYLFFTPASSD